jgi:hypothetical protein
VARDASAALGRRYDSDVVGVSLPRNNHAVVITGPVLAKELFATGTDLLAPPIHGKRMRSYETIIEEEVLREFSTWPEGREFETLEPMLRITVGAILRAVFGAEGPKLDELRWRCCYRPAMKTASRSRTSTLPTSC